MSLAPLYPLMLCLALGSPTWPAPDAAPPAAAERPVLAAPTRPSSGAPTPPLRPTPDPWEILIDVPNAAASGLPGEAHRALTDRAQRSPALRPITVAASGHWRLSFVRIETAPLTGGRVRAEVAVAVRGPGSAHIRCQITGAATASGGSDEDAPRRAAVDGAIASVIRQLERAPRCTRP